MKTLKTVLNEEVYFLEQLMKQAQARLAKAPKGFLRIVKKRTWTEYYYKGAETSRNGRYIAKSEFELVQKIVQRDYDEQLVKTAEKRVNAITEFLRIYDMTDLKEAYRKMNPHRRELLITHVLSDEEYIREWQSVEYEGKLFIDENQEIVTERGERVRSKSEKIIADKLNMLGIPYRYEYPLVLEGNVKVYPDFTILKMPEREEVYLEHFGMMDDEDYVENVLFKLATYEKNEIYLGVKLFVTYETGKRQLNTRTLDKMLRKLFCDT